VSLKVPGKDLVVKTDQTLDEGKADGGAEEPSAEPAAEAAAADEAPPAVVVERPKEPGDDRKAARCQRELERPPVHWQRIDQKLVEENHMRRAPGMIYGLEFPWNEATLEEMGPEWLTLAMHTVGSLPEDNKVTKIILEQKIKVTTGNNGGKFLFEVEYEKEDPTLHTKLFAKVPFALEGVTKSDRMSSSVNKQPAELYEINTYRLLEATLPMKTPTFYFGDISNETSNWIIITERVAFKDFDCNNFGKPTKEKKELLPAYEVEGPYDKCIDYNLRGNEKDYYACLIQVGARMAGLSKTGKLGSEELMKVSFNSHPDPSDPMFWGLNPNGSTGENPKQYKAKLDFAISFMSDTGKVIFQKYVPKEPFQNKLRKTMMTLSAYSAEVFYWKFKDLDYVALGHMNLNVDNAYFWRDESGKLDCGVFDWGSMGAGCMGHKLWWWLYCRDYEPFKRHLSSDLKLFIDAYHASGGPLLDKKKLEQMVVMTAMEQLHGLIAAVPQIYKMCPKKEWATIKDRYDSRIGENIDGKSTIRLYLHVINTITRIIEEMKGDKVLDTWIRDVYEGEYKSTPKTEAMIFG